MKRIASIDLIINTEDSAERDVTVDRHTTFDEVINSIHILYPTVTSVVATITFKHGREV